MPQVIKEILTTFEAARLCHVSYNTIKNWIKRGLLGAYRTAGGHLRIKFADLEVFCREHSIPLDKQTVASRRKVLIIDDEEAIRTALQETIGQYAEKFDIYTAADGFEAGSLMESVKPDLVLLDLVMPGMDGFKVCQNIRNSPGLKHVKIAVLTGFPSDRNFERATELGANVCIAKPIDRAQLFDIIKSLMEPPKGVRGKKQKKTKRGK